MFVMEPALRSLSLAPSFKDRPGRTGTTLRCPCARLLRRLRRAAAVAANPTAARPLAARPEVAELGAFGWQNIWLKYHDSAAQEIDKCCLSQSTCIYLQYILNHLRISLPQVDQWSL